jgi:hypothetical protein
MVLDLHAYVHVHGLNSVLFQVKKHYRKACLSVHPDKVSQNCVYMYMYVHDIVCECVYMYEWVLYVPVCGMIVWVWYAWGVLLWWHSGCFFTCLTINVLCNHCRLRVQITRILPEQSLMNSTMPTLGLRRVVLSHSTDSYLITAVHYDCNSYVPIGSIIFNLFCVHDYGFWALCIFLAQHSIFVIIIIIMIT